MYVGGGRRGYPGEVRLVRVRPCDSRAGRHMKRRRTRRGFKAAALGLAAASLLGACLCGIYLLVDSRPQGEVVELMAEKLPEEVPGSPLDVGSVNIMQALEKPEPEPQPQEQPTQQPTPEPEAAGGPVVAIVPGYGGAVEDTGSGGVTESQVGREIAARLEVKLQEMGFKTLLLGGEDVSAAAGADIYIGIRPNACAQSESAMTGIETFYPQGLEDGRRLARLVQGGAVDGTGTQDRQVREAGESDRAPGVSIPFCLVEAGFVANDQEWVTVMGEEYQENLAAGIAQGVDYYFNPKTMYLTFDDGPSEENTTAVLDILKEKGIKATFFLVGENVNKHPEVARRIVEEGHTIGIHCNRHVYEDLYASVDSYLEDFQKAYDTVYEVTGVEVVLFRFPGGSINSYNKAVYEDIIQEMESRGFIYFDWNASLEDAARNTTPEKLLQNARNSVMGRKRVVMLAHDILYNTTQCLEELLDSFPEYKMEPLTPEVDPIHF